MTNEQLQAAGWQPITDESPAQRVVVHGFHRLSVTHRHTVGFCFRVDGVWYDAKTNERLRCQPNFWQPLKQAD